MLGLVAVWELRPMLGLGLVLGLVPLMPDF
jgi:hypothetical protein